MTTSISRTLPTLAFAGSLPTLGLMFASYGSHSLAGPHPTTISGRLTYNGRPLSDSTVVLVPAGHPSTSLAALGEVSPDGSFTIRSVTAEKPLEPGQYDLYISLFEALPTAAEQVRFETEDPGPGGQASSSSPASLRQGRIPNRFSKPETSGLSVTISPGPRRIDRIDINLTD
jgi:hypothetical protein